MPVNQNAIFGPFFVMMGLTAVVWLFMYVKRIRFLNSVNIEPNELTPAKLAEISPPAVANPSDNLKNLFEMPVLFYAMALYLYSVGQVDSVHLTAAWVFVAFRGAHSAVHCTVNIVMVRFGLYALSSLALWFMALRAAFEFFGA
jgi:hypothetical protein